MVRAEVSRLPTLRLRPRSTLARPEESRRISDPIDLRPGVVKTPRRPPCCSRESIGRWKSHCPPPEREALVRRRWNRRAPCQPNCDRSRDFMQIENKIELNCPWKLYRASPIASGADSISRKEISQRFDNGSPPFARGFALPCATSWIY